MADPTPPSSPHARRRRWPAVVTILVLALAGAMGGYIFARPVTVELVNPARGPAVEAVYATGVVEAVHFARVGSTVAGRINKLLVDDGAFVRAGQLIAQLDDSQPRQRLAEAQARLATAQDELTRGQELARRGIRSQQQLQRDIELRDTTQAAVTLLARQLGEYSITTPLDGTVMKRLVEPGETIEVGKTMFEITSTRKLRIAGDVDERDIARVRLGARVAIRAEAFPGEATTASVTNIRPQGDPATRTFRVEADLPEGTSLLAGMTVDVNIVLAERSDALVIPAEAVRYGTSQRGQPDPATVFRVTGNRAVATPVELGAVGGGRVEIRSGLAADAQVISPLPATVADGDRVDVR